MEDTDGVTEVRTKLYLNGTLPDLDPENEIGGASITGLDPSTTQDFYRVIRHLNREEQVAVLMVSHDIQNIVAQANKILHLKQSVLFYGSVEDYKQAECGREFLGGGK